MVSVSQGNSIATDMIVFACRAVAVIASGRAVNSVVVGGGDLQLNTV
jgi:hypothetical protein